MSAGAPWSVKGIDPKAREAAKDLARRSGMTLGEWLNNMILEEDGPDEVASQSFFDRARGPALGAEPAIKRYEVADHPADDPARVIGLLDNLSHRIESAEARAAAAIGGVEQQVRRALERIEAAERDKVSVSARFEGLASEIGDGQGRLVERIHRLEQEQSGPRSVEALRSLETALGKVANHLYEAESRSRQRMADVEVRLERMTEPAAVQAMVDQVVGQASERLQAAEARTAETLSALQASFAALDQRLQPLEEAGGAGRLEQLAASLTQRVETARVEMTEKLRAAADDRFERVERRLGEMTEYVRRAEQTSAQAIERMGREVIQVADNFGRRIGDVEAKTAQTAQQLTGEVGRLAQAAEQRFARVDQAQAEALARLGGEITKITERLTDRIGGAERRTAAAVDDISEQVVRVTERFNQRHERTADDIAERIRQSEERTGRLLDEARERIERRLTETQARRSEPAGWPAVSSSMDAALGPDVLSELSAQAELADPFGRGRSTDEDLFDTPFGKGRPATLMRGDKSHDRLAADRLFAGGYSADDDFLEDLAEPVAAEPEPEPEPEPDSEPEAESVALSPGPVAETEATAADAPVSEAEPVNASAMSAAERFAPIAPAPEIAAPVVEAAEAAPSSPSTREVIEQARAAARAAQGKSSEAPSLLASLAGGKRAAGRRQGPTAQTAALVFAGGVALGLGALGYVFKDGGGQLPKRVADQIAMARSGGEVKGGEVDPSGTGAPRLSVALAPRAANPGDETPRFAPPAGQSATIDMPALYAQAVREVEGSDPKGVADLRKVANLGYAPAQFYLAKLHESGEGGVKKSPEEARRWTERAAQGGERKAMHNLALYYFEGAGGSKNAAVAAQWFRRAADLGLVDSQHNLGRLYEEGFGVPQNAAEAYKWYLIAGRTGDEESRASAARVRAQLSSQAQSTAERAASVYRAAGPGAPVVASSGVSIATAQRALTKLGYYQGPADGASSPALRLAVAAYQREQGLAATGALDAPTLSKLAVFVR